MTQYNVIVGGAGFIGSHLAEYLSISEPDKELIIIDNLSRGYMENIRHVPHKLLIEDFRNTNEIKKVLKKYFIHTIYNLATTGLIESLDNPEQVFMDEVEIAKTGCQLVREKVCERLVHFSSSEVYGNVSYDIESINDPKNPTTTYAVGKLAGQNLVKNYIDLYKINAYIIIPFNNFGPRQTPYKTQGIIPTIIRQAMMGHPVTVNGDGSQVRNYIYVKDTIKWMNLVINFYPTQERIFNIGANNKISVLGLIDKIMKLGHFNYQLEYKDKRPGDQSYLSCDIKSLINLTDFDLALSKTIDYYKEIYKDL